MRRTFGISAHEVMCGMPAWEVDVLVKQWKAEQREIERAQKRRSR